VQGAIILESDFWSAILTGLVRFAGLPVSGRAAAGGALVLLLRPLVDSR
jgi:hypothetical protein